MIIGRIQFKDCMFQLYKCLEIKSVSKILINIQGFSQMNQNDKS